MSLYVILVTAPPTGRQEVTLVLQLSLDLHKMFTYSCAIDSVDRNEQLAGKVQLRVTDAGSEVFVLAAV